MLTKLDPIKEHDFWLAYTEMKIIDYYLSFIIWEAIAADIRNKTPNDHFGPSIER